MSSAAAPLSSDDLGEVGEAAFAFLCSRAPLVANKVGRDRAGWDFVVQAPADPGDAPMDARSVLWTNYVQVKAVWRNRARRVRLTLSAAEKLAKQTEPAFVAAFLYDRTNLDSFDFYMVEMTGERLAAILKALRENERAGRRGVNEVYTYLVLKSEERIEPTGDAIRERLALPHREAAPGPYTVRKARELETIGYDDRPIRGVITLHDIDRHELVDVLLGRRDWKASLTSMVETRFGIDLPLKNAPLGPGSVRFTPNPQATCSLIVPGKGSARTLHFVGDHHHVVLPAPDGLVEQSRFVFPGFAIDYSGGPVSLETTLAEDAAMSLADWRRFWRLMERLKDVGASFTLRSPRFSKPLTWRFKASSDRFPSDVWESSAVVEAAYDLDEDLNLGIGPLTMADLTRSAKALMMARHFGLPGRRRLRISIGSEQAGEPGYQQSAQDGVYVDFADLGGRRIGFAVTIRLVCREGEPDLWESTCERRIEVRQIGPSPEDFAVLTRDAKRSAKTTTLFLGDIDDGFLRSALGEIAPF